VVKVLLLLVVMMMVKVVVMMMVVTLHTGQEHFVAVHLAMAVVVLAGVAKAVHWGAAR
jgi:hypothetical protein